VSEAKRKYLFDFLLISATVFVAYFFIQKLFFLLFPVGVAFLFSEMIRNSFRRLKPLSNAVKKALIVLILLIFFALLSLVAVMLTERLIHWLSQWAESLSDGLNDAVSFSQSLLQKLEDFLSRILHRNLENSVIDRTSALFLDVLNRILSSIPTWIGALINRIPRFFISLFIFVISTYYFSCDWGQLSSIFSRRLTEKKKEAFRLWKVRFLRSLYQYGKAYLILFLLTFAQLFLGFFIFQIPGAWEKAFFIAIVDILPIFGCGTVLIPWGIGALICKNAALGIRILSLYVILFVIRQILEPKIVGSSIGLHPILSLILILIGLYFFGFTGMILLPLIATCVLQSLEEKPPIEE